MSEVIGILIEKLEVKQVNDNFTTRDFILKTDFNTQWPQEIQFQLHNQKCDLLNSIPMGIQIKVHYVLNGKSYTPSGGGEKRWFNTLKVWKIDRI